MDLEMVTLYLVINEMESEPSRSIGGEKSRYISKNVALGEVREKNSPIYRVSGEKRAHEEN